jgi:hypothetical protein
MESDYAQYVSITKTLLKQNKTHYVFNLRLSQDLGFHRNMACSLSILFNEWVSECWLFNANSTICQLYHGEN